MDNMTRIRTNLFNFNSTRKWLQRVFLREVKAGFLPVCFIDFWLADQFNSLAMVFLDIEYFFCFFINAAVQQSRSDENYELPLQNDVQVNSTVPSEQFLCGTYSYGLRYFIAIIPAYIRFARVRMILTSMIKNWWGPFCDSLTKNDHGFDLNLIMIRSWSS